MLLLYAALLSSPILNWAHAFSNFLNWAHTLLVTCCYYSTLLFLLLYTTAAGPILLLLILLLHWCWLLHFSSTLLLLLCLLAHSLLNFLTPTTIRLPLSCYTCTTNLLLPSSSTLVLQSEQMLLLYCPSMLAGYFWFVQVLLCLLSYLSISGCSFRDDLSSPASNNRGGQPGQPPRSPIVRRCVKEFV
jgi:hypothetical protein